MAILRHQGAQEPPADALAGRLASLERAYRELIEAVREMRVNQRGYFNTRQGDPGKKTYWLGAIKGEQHVDKLLRDAQTPAPNQAQLF